MLKPSAADAVDAARCAVIASSSASGDKAASLTAAQSEEQVKHITEAFELFDSNKSGTIDLGELNCAVRALGFSPKQAKVSFANHSVAFGEPIS